MMIKTPQVEECYDVRLTLFQYEQILILKIIKVQINVGKILHLYNYN